VQLEDERILRVTEEEVIRFSLYEGMELSAEEAESLLRAAAASGTKTAAVNMIGSRALSKKELQQRLVRKGAAQEDARSAADWLEEIGAIDDANYAGVIARHYASRGYGAARVREELRHRGVDRALWDDALEELPPPEEAIEAFLAKRRGDLSDPKERKRTVDVLLRRGFSWGDVRSVLSRYAEMEE